MWARAGGAEGFYTQNDKLRPFAPVYLLVFGIFGRHVDHKLSHCYAFSLRCRVIPATYWQVFRNAFRNSFFQLGNSRNLQQYWTNSYASLGPSMKK